ncbi:hypothetical protein CHAB381_1174 [Campylobacter hominis ATCC BAA-381]|uniref:Uncharacterized protein n=1 Tax=Campylobacter hominis (strain ATCC BAA-381 / DSM 21671 / CCUG 45161 / LMG 19568 / NCTC 13146 / CH001A) TaxID=360107 RepID=A7I2I8_CAMHC|nr:hypothetical protein CHAB381_1174 [Campylobacter hominis ATCC BAA-381]
MRDRIHFSRSFWILSVNFKKCLNLQFCIFKHFNLNIFKSKILTANFKIL